MGCRVGRLWFIGTDIGSTSLDNVIDARFTLRDIVYFLPFINTLAPSAHKYAVSRWPGLCKELASCMLPAQ